MKHFSYVRPDITVITALTDEHMEYFKTMDAVAAEELFAAGFSNQTLINVDDSPAQYLKNVTSLSYGTHGIDYQLRSRHQNTNGRQVLQLGVAKTALTVETSLLGEQGAKAVLAAVAVADLCELNAAQITAGAARITAVAGRMQILPGLKKSVLIDDSYNASPVAVKAALDVLYEMPAVQRIAVLGNMNEMGSLSPAMHTDVGQYCDPARLDMVLTLGPDANAYLAPAAEAAGCTVKQCKTPYEAGEYLLKQLQPGSAVLVKGSQNGVFSEETVKLLLADPTDSAKLVRQSAYWLKKKRAQFKR